MDEQVSLLINGKQYKGWTEISLNTAMDALAGAFAISLTERWAGDGRTPSQIEAWPILNGDRCQITIGGEAVIDGYVDQFRPSFSATDHTIEIQGRDKTGDLIDCTAFHQPDQWKNVDLLEIAKILCKPFGISVTAEVDVGPRFDVVKLQQGETVFAALDRLARFRKVLLCSGIAGGLLITQAGRSRATVRLQQGVNIKSASGVLDTSQRFSNYIVKGQNVSSKTEDAELEAHAEARVTDSAVPRYRPLVVMAETGATNGSAAERATWEANVRLGRSATATVTLRGWRQGLTGPLWKPNQLVGVSSTLLRMDGDMLIRQVTYKRSGSSGTECELSLISPQAFSPEPPDKKAEAPKEKREKNGGRNIWREALGDDGPST